MAPNVETISGSNKSSIVGNQHKPPRLAMDGLQRAISDVSMELAKEEAVDGTITNGLPAISEVEDAKCECCGMSKQCTVEFINREREKFLGRLICGLCGAAVKEEMEKNGGKIEEALDEHMTICARFTRVGRAYPVLHQAEVMKEIFKRRAKSMSPKQKVGPEARITRCSSCIPDISRGIEDGGGAAID